MAGPYLLRENAVATELKFGDLDLDEAMSKVASMVEAKIQVFPGFTDEQLSELSHAVMQQILEMFREEGKVDGHDLLIGGEDLLYVLITGIFLGRILGDQYV